MGLQSLSVCEVSYTYLLGCFRYQEKQGKHILIGRGVCYCLQTCNSVVHVLVMGLVLGASLMVISITEILYMQKYVHFVMYNGSVLLLFTRKLHCLQICKHTSAHWAIKVYVFVKFHTHIY